MAESMEIHIEENGDVDVPFFPVSFSEFIIDNIMTEEERNSTPSNGRIYCG